MKTKSLSVIAIVFATALSVITGCKKENEIPTLKVASIRINKDAANVGINQAIAIVCDKDVDLSTVNENSITVLGGTNNRIPIKLSCYGKEIVFEPQAEYFSTTKYTVNLSGLKAKDGSSLLPYSFSFTTERAELGIVSTSPNAGDLKVDANAIINIVFSRAIDKSSVKSGNIVLMDNTGVKVPFSFRGDYSTLSIRPINPLSEKTTYTVKVSGIKANDGVVTNDCTFNFTTEEKPFCVTSVIPASGSTDIETNAEFKIVFNKEILKGDYSDNVYIYETSSLIAPAVAICDGNTLTVKAKWGFKSNINYEIALIGIKSVDSMIAKTYRFSFKTK